MGLGWLGGLVGLEVEEEEERGVVVVGWGIEEEEEWGEEDEGRMEVVGWVSSTHYMHFSSASSSIIVQ